MLGPLVDIKHYDCHTIPHIGSPSFILTASIAECWTTMGGARAGFQTPQFKANLSDQRLEELLAVLDRISRYHLIPSEWASGYDLLVTTPPEGCAHIFFLGAQSRMSSRQNVHAYGGSRHH